jgi:hypothetical protein
MSSKTAVVINLIGAALVWLLLSMVEGQTGIGRALSFVSCFAALWCAYQVLKAKFPDDDARA